MSDIINSCRKARNYSLGDNWDIYFEMDSKLFSQILSFVMQIESDVPFKFYKERIFIHTFSYKKSLYAEVEITKDLLANYEIKWGKNRENKMNVEEYKLVLIDLKGMVREIGKFVKEEKKIIVKIDSLKTRRAEFIIGELNTWMVLINPKNFNEKRVLELSKKISDIRNNSDKAILIMHHESFERVYNLKKKERDIDLKLLFYVNKEGLTITSGNFEEGRIIDILPVDFDALDIEEFAELKTQEERKNQLLQESDISCTGNECHAKGFPYKKRDMPKKRKRSNGQVKDGHELSALTVEDEQLIQINVTKLAILSQIKIDDDITMEIITDNFIYLENYYQGIKFVLVVKAEKAQGDITIP